MGQIINVSILSAKTSSIISNEEEDVSYCACFFCHMLQRLFD